MHKECLTFPYMLPVNLFQPRSICSNLIHFFFFAFAFLRNIFGTFNVLFIFLLLYLPHLLFPPCSPNIPTCILFILMLGSLEPQTFGCPLDSGPDALPLSHADLNASFFNYIYIVVLMNFLKLFKSDILIKENIPAIITLQYIYLCPNCIQINLQYQINLG